jgi:hypothetical protein
MMPVSTTACPVCACSRPSSCYYIRKSTSRRPGRQLSRYKKHCPKYICCLRNLSFLAVCYHISVSMSTNILYPSTRESCNHRYNIASMCEKTTCSGCGKSSISSLISTLQLITRSLKANAHGGLRKSSCTTIRLKSRLVLTPYQARSYDDVSRGKGGKVQLRAKSVYRWQVVPTQS